MKSIVCILVLAISIVGAAPSALAQSAEKEALRVAQDLLDAIGQGDTIAFRRLFLPGAMIYTIREKDGQPVAASRSPFKDTFRSGTVIRETMRDTGVEVQVHGHMAQVWAPYDLWVNDVFSHCGIDVFTLIRTPQGWRIASLSYTIEKEGCGEGK